jgi:cobalt-zinc-cadmium efflux system membrane fusion protein
MKTRLITIVTGTILLGCSGSGEEAQPAIHDHANEASLTLEDSRVLDLETTLPAYHIAGDTLELRGMVDAPPQSMIDVALPYGGMITKLNFYSGSYVKKGELLAEVKHQDYIDLQEGYLSALASLEELDAAWQRQETLKEKESTSEKAYQEARSSYRAASAKLKGVEARLRLAGISPEAVRTEGIQETIRVYAPVSGFITDILTNIGMYVPEDASIYRLIDTEHLHVELNAYPDDVATLHKGQKVNFRLRKSGRVHQGEIYLISQYVAENRTVTVHVHPDGEIPGMLPGMFVQATVQLGTDSIWGIPASGGQMIDGKLHGLALEGESFVLVEFDEDQISKNGFIRLDQGEKRAFVTGHLDRAIAAYLGESEAEAGHSH